MIFLAVSTFGFERLVRKMDEIAASIDEEVIMQIGRGKYVPRNASYFDFAGEQELGELCRRARVVVTHGAMTMVDALRAGTPVIAVPRLKKYGEAIDDHQFYLIQELERQGTVVAVYDVEELATALKAVPASGGDLAGDRRLVDALRSHIARFERN